MKKELRKKYLTIRKEITQKDSKDKIICEKFLNMELYKKSDTILAYYPINTEINIIPIIKRALNDNKKVALPKTIDKSGNMEFYFINNLNNLVKGNFEIMEPIMEPKNKVLNYNNALIIIPGICFDLNNYRLGYGKGYYDRFLKKISIMSVGLCYQECLINNIEVDEYDQKVDIVLTDKI